MLDGIYVLICFVFCGACLLYTKLCGRLSS